MAYRPGKCRLHHILREKNLNLSKLSEMTGIRYNQLSDYSNNHRIMSLPNAITIAFAVGLPIEDLYDWIEY